ncbi:hypothetical protein SELMODRAFT_403763 [Selaginella moellendorffii]|uniref:Terpene synthase metal-binding domain-containing protein n=1 Tax=Selaginella moellendorffii TaxID=88036 RepID=D8QSG1_SELML|nr:hypothetical protein SELMODRAFT_403763 [Selaginella moellendorffii]
MASSRVSWYHAPTFTITNINIYPCRASFHITNQEPQVVSGDLMLLQPDTVVAVDFITLGMLPDLFEGICRLTPGKVEELMMVLHEASALRRGKRHVAVKSWEIAIGNFKALEVLKQLLLITSVANDALEQYPTSFVHTYGIRSYLSYHIFSFLLKAENARLDSLFSQTKRRRFHGMSERTGHHKVRLQCLPEDISEGFAAFYERVKRMWNEECDFERLGFAQHKDVFCFCTAAATMFQPELSMARTVRAQTSVLTTVIDDFMDTHHTLNNNFSRP